jgi:cyclopropane fatty-acyl-phospholipid synthase-like methyltransferase
MWGSGLLNWFAHVAAAPQSAAMAVGSAAVRDAPAADPASERAGTDWTTERLAVNDALWGPGYVFPGGELETLRMAKPLGLSAASSVLLLGIGAGGPGCSLAHRFGAWVSGYEADIDLAVAATERALRANLGRRVQVEHWDPAAPELAEHFFHHAMALEAMRGALPEPFLTAVTRSLKPGGQLSMLELVADEPLEPAEPLVAAWGRLERRAVSALPAETAVTRILGRLGFDVRIVEDLSDRHIQQAMIGWRRTVRGLATTKPSVRQAAQIVAEAELWLLRLRMIGDRRLRLIRWHAIRH